jgi:hypothetical protein
MTPEVELIRALAEDLALEILVSYTPEDFQQADFTSLGMGLLHESSHRGFVARMGDLAAEAGGRKRTALFLVDLCRAVRS